MIQKLRLTRFGKFENTVFDFAPVTLFFGENETGKTTLFDALFYGLCAPKKTTIPGKRLALRYGDERLARIDFEGEALKFSEDDFLNLFAVRSGDITLAIDKNSEWMNQVKAALFSGGIDPGTAIARLGTIIDSTAQGSFNKEASFIKADMKELRAELEKAQTIREECLAGEKRIETMNLRIKETERETITLAAEIEGLEKSLYNQNLLKEEKTARDMLSGIAEARRKKEELTEKYSRYTREKFEDLKRRETDVLRLKTEIEKIESAGEDAARVYQRYGAEKDRRETEKNRAERAQALAGALRDTLVPREKLLERKTRVFVRKIPLAAGIAAFLLGAAFLVWGPAVSRVWLFAGSIALGFLLTGLSFARKTWEDTARLEEALKTVRERWRTETGENLEGGYEDALSALDRASERAGFAAKDYDWIMQQAAAYREQADSSALRKIEAENAYSAAFRELNELLNSAGVSGTADYAAGLAKKESLETQYTEWEINLRSDLEACNAVSVTELENILGRKIAEIGEKVTEAPQSAQELRLKQNSLRDKKLKLETLRREEKESRGNFSESLGDIRGRFRGIPERIAACEKKLVQDESRLAEIEKELRAAKIAREIFLSLSGDADITLRELSREIGETFSFFTAEKRVVELKTYSPANAVITDAGGGLRDGEMLSAGTRDAFLLAARLVLARKSQTEGRRALIVLDEPFIALDRTRTGRALAALEEFRKTAGWQIVLFTKDEGMEKQAREIFGGALRIHKLDH